MRLVSPSDPTRCVPFLISTGEGTEGAMLGGRAPDGISPTPGRESLRYFATVPITTSPSVFASIFVADLEALMEVRGGVSRPDLVRVVVHPSMERGPSSRFDSLLSEHSLLLAGPADDLTPDDDGVAAVRPGHKIGGTPHLVRRKAPLLDAIERLRRDRYVLVAQFDFPHGVDAVVSGDWPFADGMFALFGREPFQEREWRWCWDF